MPIVTAPCPRYQVVMPRVEIISGERAGVSVDLLPGGTLGSAPTAAVRLKGAGVASEHARLEGLDGDFHLVDLGSAAGTYVNDERLAARGRCAVRSGDRIRLGAVKLEFKGSRAKAFPKTQVLGGPVTFSTPPREVMADEVEGEGEGENEEDGGDEPTFDRTIFVAPPNDPPPEGPPPSHCVPDEASPTTAPRTKRLGPPGSNPTPAWERSSALQASGEDDLAADPVASAPPSEATPSPSAATGPSHEELQAALDRVHHEIEAARAACRRQVDQAREALKRGRLRFQQAAAQQRRLHDQALAALRARDAELQAERQARGLLQTQLEALQARAAPTATEPTPAELEEVKAEAEELRNQLEELNDDLISISDERDALAAELEELRGAQS